jgi:GTPase SAR1 family protein
MRQHPQTLLGVSGHDLNIFACNIGEHVNLLQLVFVGDQSSGKSSVLAGLMRLPFPRDSGLCTRFATQVLFRRSDMVRAWSVTDLKTLDADSFAKIMKDVSALLLWKVFSETVHRRIG